MPFNWGDSAVGAIVTFFVGLGFYIYIEYYKDAPKQDEKLVDVGKLEREWAERQSAKKKELREEMAKRKAGRDNYNGNGVVLEEKDDGEKGKQPADGSKERAVDASDAKQNVRPERQGRRPAESHEDMRAKRLEALAKREPDSVEIQKQKEAIFRRQEKLRARKRVQLKEYGLKGRKSASRDSVDKSVEEKKEAAPPKPTPKPKFPETEGNKLGGNENLANATNSNVEIKEITTAPAYPSISPLESCDELRSWTRTRDHVTTRASIPWTNVTGDSPSNPRETASPSRSQLLVCHDFNKTYSEDSCPLGNNLEYVYNFTHWQYVDIFVYFSHSRVTIPPPVWTNTAHRHGTKVLGTFITEHQEGALDFDKVIGSRMSTYVQQLVDIAACYGFDGWLLNIEHPVSTNKVPRVVDFVRELTAAMHQRIPHSVVLWYDSITAEGKLQWQNELNGRNKLFFEASDGIFLNYAWNLGKLENSATVAGDRLRAVYAGVDVHGRGTYGGGQMSTHKGVEPAFRRGMSSAIFAPAWTKENHLDEAFDEINAKFWALISQYVPPRASGSRLPWHTTFDTGRGQALYQEGRLLGKGQWFCMSNQSLQLSYPTTSLPVPGLDFATPLRQLKKRAEVDVFFADSMAYNGGASLKLVATLWTPLCGQLFKTNLRATKDLSLRYTFLPLKVGYQCPFSLVLILNNGEKAIQLDPPVDESSEAALVPTDLVYRPSTRSSEPAPLSRLPASEETKSAVYIGSQPAPRALQWHTRTYHNLLSGSEYENATITDVHVVLGELSAEEENLFSDGPPRTTLYLGDICIASEHDLTRVPDNVQNIKCTMAERTSQGTTSSRRLHGQLVWDKIVPPSITDRCLVYCNDIYLGIAYGRVFPFRGVPPSKDGKYVFSVQPVSVTGVPRPIIQCNKIVISE